MRVGRGVTGARRARGFPLARPMLPPYTDPFHAIGRASVAQRQSIGFVNRGLRVQVPPLACQGKDATLARGQATETGRWQSGQLHQTVNLAVSDLRRFESCSAQLNYLEAGVAQLAER